MVNSWVNFRVLRAALSALLVLVVALAPLEARFLTAVHTHGGVSTTSAAEPADLPHHTTQTSTKDHEHQDHGHEHHDHGGVKSSSKMLELVGSSGSSVAVVADEPPADTQHDHTQHDHSGSADGGCCGTFCHSACIEAAILNIPSPILIGRFTHIPVGPFTAIAPGLLQRPPSIYLSI